ncbi:MAG TPA: 16S rRNA (cytosine(1402)-N(4))-methyltransferase RsmH [Myxococcota bacterium]
MVEPFAHRPVLLAESLELLALHPGAVVVDGTVGGGGHAAAILERTAPDGRLIGFDMDDDALASARRSLLPFGDRVQLLRASFRELPEQLSALRSPRIDAVLLDLGVSSHQLDSPSRGFRFADATAAETPLDMRMDRRSPVTAAEILRTRSADELAAIFREGGELPGAGRLARRLVEARQRAPLLTTRDLLRAIEAARVGGGRRHHPATLVFQALRIAVNDEIGALREGLDAAILALRPKGRLVVIAYHSLEDRCVKHRFREAERGCTCPPRIPVCVCGGVPLLRVLTRRPLRPGPAEIQENPRARSARLRAAERIAEAA